MAQRLAGTSLDTLMAERSMDLVLGACEYNQWAKDLRMGCGYLTWVVGLVSGTLFWLLEKSCSEFASVFDAYVFSSCFIRVLYIEALWFLLLCVYGFSCTRQQWNDKIKKINPMFTRALMFLMASWHETLSVLYWPSVIGPRWSTVDSLHKGPIMRAVIMLLLLFLGWKAVEQYAELPVDTKWQMAVW